MVKPSFDLSGCCFRYVRGGLTALPAYLTKPYKISQNSFDWTRNAKDETESQLNGSYKISQCARSERKSAWATRRWIQDCDDGFKLRKSGIGRCFSGSYEAAFAAWTDRMQTLDQDARKYEIANLPISAVVALTSVNDRAELHSKVATCGDLLKTADFQNVKKQQELSKSVSAPDDYITLRRVLGIYPLTSMFVYRGVSIWHAEARKSFSAEPPVNWRSIRYIPAKKIDISSAAQTVEATKRDALGIPVYAPEEREALFRMYAPVWEIRFEGDYDRIGAPTWSGKGVLDVDTDQPVTYTLLSFTKRFITADAITRLTPQIGCLFVRR